MEAALKHIFSHHSNADGWVALAKKEQDTFKQYHFKIDGLQDQLSAWIGEDVYFSQNTFYVPKRRIEHIRELRALYCDIDLYKTNFTIDQVKMALEMDYYRQIIPEPNHIIHSGRGLVLVWLIEPVPYKALPRWQAVENYIVGQLKDFGADSHARDAARIFRIAGSTNSKNKKTVTVEYRHDYKFDLEQLKTDYLPEIKKKFKKVEASPKKNSKKVTSLFNTYMLHFARLRDLCELVKLRGYSMKGYRETTLFLYRYWSCCFSFDKGQALQHTLDFNSEFTEPLPQREVERATQSADRAYEQWSLNSVNGTYKRGGYNFSNERLIGMLDISDIEQRNLKTIISKEEKQRRNTIAKRNMRRKKGINDRDSYISEQNDITNMKLYAMSKMIADNPMIKNKELADSLGISVARIKQLKAFLK